MQLRKKTEEFRIQLKKKNRFQQIVNLRNQHKCIQQEEKNCYSDKQNLIHKAQTKIQQFSQNYAEKKINQSLKNLESLSKILQNLTEEQRDKIISQLKQSDLHTYVEQMFYLQEIKYEQTLILTQNLYIIFLDQQIAYEFLNRSFLNVMLKILRKRDVQLFINITWAFANSVGESKEIKKYYKQEKIFDQIVQTFYYLVKREEHQKQIAEQFFYFSQLYHCTSPFEQFFEKTQTFKIICQYYPLYEICQNDIEVYRFLQEFLNSVEHPIHIENILETPNFDLLFKKLLSDLKKTNSNKIKIILYDIAFCILNQEMLFDHFRDQFIKIILLIQTDIQTLDTFLFQNLQYVLLLLSKKKKVAEYIMSQSYIYPEIFKKLKSDTKQEDRTVYLELLLQLFQNQYLDLCKYFKTNQNFFEILLQQISPENSNINIITTVKIVDIIINQELEYYEESVLFNQTLKDNDDIYDKMNSVIDEKDKEVSNTILYLFDKYLDQFLFYIK